MTRNFEKNNFAETELKKEAFFRHEREVIEENCGLTKER
jgi:hypothetical protein